MKRVLWSAVLVCPRHEQQDEHIGKTYPIGIHGAIAEGLEASGGFDVRTATLQEPEHGLRRFDEIT